MFVFLCVCALYFVALWVILSLLLVIMGSQRDGVLLSVSPPIVYITHAYFFMATKFCCCTSGPKLSRSAHLRLSLHLSSGQIYSVAGDVHVGHVITRVDVTAASVAAAMLMTSSNTISLTSSPTSSQRCILSVIASTRESFTYLNIPSNA